MLQDTPVTVTPVLARVAAIVAFILAGLLLISAIAQITLLPFALVPLLAGIGILRRRVWSAYGFAVFEAAQLLLLLIVLLRDGPESFPKQQVILLLAIDSFVISLFWLAGRSLSKAGGTRGWAWRWMTVSACCTVPLLFLQAFVIPTGAMENTLLIGDHVFVQTFPRPAVHRGDIVAFFYPIDRKQKFIKRVIGVPGDRIRLSRKTVYRNGSALVEPYVVYRFPFNSYRDDFPSGTNSFPLPPAGLDMLAKHVVNGEVVVPPGKYFVLGDNRDNSLDSRFWGFLDGKDIIGEPRLIYDSSAPAGNGVPALTRIRWNRLFKIL